MGIFLDFIYLLAGVAYSPKIVYRAVRHKRYRTGWAQRLGKISRTNPRKKCIWLHAVSVGEVNAAKTIIAELAKRFSDHEIVISTTTDTGFTRASNLFGGSYQVFYFPFDFTWVIRRAFTNIQPAMCLLLELEVWPNFIDIAHRQGVPVIVVNGRISEKSFSGYRKIKPFAKKIFSKINLILAQTEEYAQRFRQIGALSDKVIVTGSLKYDTAEITDKVNGSDILAEKLNLGNEHLWVAGGTGNDEEKMVLDVYQDLKKQDRFEDLHLVIVPRKPERFDEVAQLIEDRNLPLIRFSRIKDGTVNVSIDKQAVILGDTMGDLRKFYSLATIIFVGRSLVPMGGSDMMEAAALGKCTMFGPYAFNFKQTVDVLLASDGAIMVKDEKDLLMKLQRCLLEPEYARKIARSGQEVIRKNQGATSKSIEQIAKFLKSA
jgi:3-deoxy-D-manno-octulosonic-acid transferase